MKILIVEDEGLAARRLKKMLEDADSRLEVLDICSSVAGTVKWLEQHTAPDLIFLDIELADGQCFELFRHIRPATPVIFTTAYDEHALKAFEVNSIAYLLKPVKEEELRTALNKFKNLQEAQLADVISNIEHLVKQIASPDASGYRQRFLVKTGQRMISVDTRQAAYFFTRNSVSFMVTQNQQKVIVEYTLDELETMLDPRYFFRANRQYIIAHNSIRAIHPWFNSKLKVELSQPVDDDIIISREKSAVFKQWMGA